MKYEIVVRRIDEEGNCEEECTIKTQDGSLPERALILAEKETQSVLCLAGCDKADACMMIHKNKEMARLARTVTLGEMAVRMIGMTGTDDEEPEKPSKDDIADGIGQAFSPD